MKKQILFVDDEDNLLSGIKRLLRSQRKKWDLYFASNGLDALEIVSKQSISVVVSDMRMPGMDGAEVLEKVSQLSPETIRFILSGQSSEESMLRALLYAHLHLSKPCDQKYMVEMLERACTLHDLVENSEIEVMTSRVGALPAIPNTYNRMVDEIAIGNYRACHLSKIISADPELTTQIKLVMELAGFNRFLGDKAPISELIEWFGADTSCMMVLLSEIYGQINYELREEMQLEKLWRHFMRSALITRHLAQHEQLAQEDIHVAEAIAMLYGIGHLVMALQAPELYREVICAIKQQCRAVDEVEKKLYRCSSHVIGAYLLALWGAPIQVIKGVAGLVDISSSCKVSYISPIAHAAIALDYEINMESAPGPAINRATIDSVDISEAQQQHWRSIALEVFDDCTT